MTEPAKLLPCPFCGGPAGYEECSQGSSTSATSCTWSVGCQNDDEDCIGYQMLAHYNRKSEAAAAWNKRAAPLHSQAVSDTANALADELREFTAMKYMGDCKCGKCQLVPRELIDRVCAALYQSPPVTEPDRDAIIQVLKWFAKAEISQGSAADAIIDLCRIASLPRDEQQASFPSTERP